MNDLFSIAINSILVLFGTIIGSFAGGGSSLIIFPTLLTFATGSYVSLLIISKLSATVMTFAAGRMHYKRNKLDMRLLFTLIVSGLFGTALGTYFLQYQFNEELFKKLLTFFIFLTAGYLFIAKERGLETSHSVPIKINCLVKAALFSFFINILNGIFGGTGLFMTVFLVVAFRLRFIKAIAYTMVNYAVISFIQTMYLMMNEPFDYRLGAAVIVMSLIGGSLGTHFQYLKGNRWVKNAAIILMIVLGIKMLY